MQGMHNRWIIPNSVDIDLAYLMGHNRPMAELLAPQAQDIEPLYRSEFGGMIYEPVGLERLQETLKQLVR